MTIVVLLTGCGRGPGYYTSRGDRFFAQGMYADASINYRKALQRNSSYGEALAGLGLTAVKLKNGSEAYQSLRQAVELLPDRDDLKVALANIILFSYLTDSRRPQAMYDQLTRLAGDLAAKDPYDSLRLRGYLAASDSRLPAASDLFAKANALKPMQPDLIYRWAQVLFENGEFTRGEKLALGLIEKDKAYLAIYDLLYEQYVAAHRPDKAESLLKTKAANNPQDAQTYLQLASYYAVAGRPEPMTAALRHLIDDPGTFPQGYSQAGDFYFKLKDPGEAIRQYEAGAKAHPADRLHYLKKIAETYVTQGKEQPALALLREVLKEKPTDEEAQAAEARLLLNSGTAANIGAAVGIFENLSKRHPDDATILLNLGRAYWAQGKEEAARKQLQRASRMGKNYYPPLMALAEIAQAKGDYQETLRCADEALAMVPNLAAAMMWRAIGLRGTGRYSEARSVLKRFGSTDNANRNVQLQLGILDLAEKKYRDAEERFQKLHAGDPRDSAALTGLVQTWVAQNQTGKALRLLEDESRKPSAPETVHTLFAELALRTSKYDLAIEEYRKLMALHPQSAELYSRLGSAYKLKGDLPNAIASVRTATELAPREPGGLALLADTLNEAGNKSEAMKYYHAALQADQQNVPVRNNLAFLIAESGGDLNEAHQLAQDAVQKAPQQPAFADTLGWIYLKQGQTDAALQIFRRNVQTVPNSPDFRYHLGLALWRIGDIPSAREELQAALSRGPSTKVRADIERVLASSGDGSK